MQKIATRVFIIASLAFGVLGITMVLGWGGPDRNPPEWLARSFFVSIFVVLSSFALSVASKYLNGKH